MRNQEDKDLEEFIRNNRENFNDCEAPAGLWDKIDISFGKRLSKNLSQMRL